MSFANGSHVLMAPSHPHEGRTGTVLQQPDESNTGMYLIEFDDIYEGQAFAEQRDLRLAPKGTNK